MSGPIPLAAKTRFTRAPIAGSWQRYIAGRITRNGGPPHIIIASSRYRSS